MKKAFLIFFGVMCLAILSIGFTNGCGEKDPFNPSTTSISSTTSTTSTTSSSQRFTVTPLILGVTNDIRYIYFYDESNGWLSASLGHLYRTTDGGDSWEDYYLGTETNNNDLYFYSITAGYLLREHGSNMYITSNGGSLFAPVDSGVTETQVLYFLDSNTGWVAGANGSIGKTTNGGLNWSPQSSGTAERFNDIFFLDSNYGWIAGNYGHVLRTVDSGEHWTSYSLEAASTCSNVSFTNSLEGWAAGFSYLYKTTNGGQTWTPIDGNQTHMSYIESVQFISTSEGYILGWNGYSALGYTFDSGDTWQVQTCEVTDRLSKLFVVNGNFILIGGTQGRAYKFTR